MIAISFVGNLGADPEVRVLENGTKVLNLRVAAQSSFKSDDPAEWLDCAMWGDRGAKLQEMLHKGSKVFIRGSFNTRKWEKEGRTGTQLEVRVDDLQLLDKRPDETATNPEGRRRDPAPAPRQNANPFRR